MTANQLVEEYGLNPLFARQIESFLQALTNKSLLIGITSGWRDPEYQKELRSRWDSGDRTGLVARPAVDSLHTRVSPTTGRPESLAIDIAVTDPQRAAEIAKDMGIGAGWFFRSPDKYHFYYLDGKEQTVHSNKSKALPFLLFAAAATGMYLMLRESKRPFHSFLKP